MNQKLLKNKWLLATLLMIIVAIAAIVVAIVLGTTADTPDAPPVLENVYGQGEEGVYYYEVVDGEVTITLRDGNFIMDGKINKTGTYSVDGSTIALDFFKDEDGTTTATLNGDTLSLVYNEATMSFLKKVEYTVSFEVDGGNEISDVKVINGKLVEKPESDPSKENHVFLGWYADAEFKTPFSFAETIVKSDLTVYAKWVEKNPTVTDYKVSFDLGYEGAPEIAPIETIAGTAYGITEPERPGYTFGGWWISMYEDGAKLSYAYSDDMKFTADTTLFAVWVEEGSTKLSAPAVSVSDSLISWAPVKDAVSYKLTIVDPAGNVIVENETVTTTTKAFEFGGRDAGEYKISVIAVSQNADKNSAPADRFFANKTLDRISGIRVENGILIFDEVENAQKYTITIDCGDENHVHTDFDNGLSTTYYLANCKMQKGGIKITVTASANGYASSVSNTFVYERNLDKITYLDYNENTDSFVWTPVPGALSYIVTVTVDGKDYVFNNDMRTSFSVAGFTGNISVSVVPAADGYNSPEGTVDTCTKTAPIVPGGLTVSFDRIFWDAVEGAVSYEVNIGGQTVPVTTNELLFADISGLTQGQTYSVKVKAINASNESSAFSSEVKVGYYVMDNTLKYSKNTVTWSPVLGVKSYKVRVNGEATQVITDATSAKVTLTKSGVNIIEVCFISGDTTSDWVSLSVTAYPVEYDSRTTTNGIVKVEYLAPGDYMSLPVPSAEYPGYDFAAWYNIPMGIEGNGKKFDETTVFNGSAYTVVYADWNPKAYDVTFITDGHQITNIQNGAKESVTYTKDFTLPVPEMKDSGMYFFAGWYTGPNGSGYQITDGTGASVIPYNYTQGLLLYPFYNTDTLEFILQADGTYAVTKGAKFSDAVNLKIPVTYREVLVTTILESAFNGKNLKTIDIPDTIRLIGTNALGNCSALEEINIYVAYPDKAGQYETIYSSLDGVLLREDTGSTYLEIFPCGKTGEYTIPAEVDKVLAKAFKYTSITSIIIPDNITSLPVDAFYYCSKLQNITFATGRTNAMEFDPAAFKECKGVQSITLPANISLEKADLVAFLNTFSALNSITIEEGGEKYASIDRLLTNAEKDTIYYAPKAYNGIVGTFTVPSGVTSIDASAFASCQNLTSVVIPVWVTSIGKSAFSNCKYITDVTFNKGRTDNLSIDSSAFAYNTSLKTVNFLGDENADELDTGVVTIGASAFRASAADKSSITSLNIGAYVNIKSIGSSAFIYQSKLTQINIADTASLKTIGESAFSGCSRLSSIVIPATVTSIEKNAFANCSNLASITFKTEGATSINIKDYAFKNSLKLVEVLLPDHLGTFNATVFEGCDLLKSINVNATNKTYISDANGVLYKKASADSDVLAELLFYPKGLAQAMNGIINNLPDTLTTIGGSAFSSNKYVKEITLPKAVKTIGADAFAHCGNLETIHFAEDGTSLTIGTRAFIECSTLSDNFELPAYTTTIGANAFEGCGFTKFTVPAGVTKISKAAFINCKNLETIVFKGNGALALGSDSTAATDGAFANCTSLKSIALPDGTTVIGKYTFYNCSSLESADLGASLTTLNVGAFNLCTAIKTITLPKTVTTVGDSAFAMAESTPGSLESVIFAEGGTAELTIGKTIFSYNPNLTSVTFPARTSKLAAAAAPTNATSTVSPIKELFLGCNKLADINISEDGESKGFSSIDGVLYNADKTVLIYCPSYNDGQLVGGVPTLIVPKTVKTVSTGAIVNNIYINTVTFEEFDKEDANYGKQLLNIGNYESTTASHYTTTTNLYNYTKYTLITIGGSRSAVKTINLPSHLAKIGAAAFTNETTDPMTLTINPDAKNIILGNYAFYLSNFESITIPGTLASAGKHAFRGASLMKELNITLPESMKSLPERFLSGCSALKSFVLPAHITALEQYAMYSCTSLTDFVIPETLTTLGNYALGGLGNKVLTIHPYFTNVGTYVFSGCKAEEVIFQLDEDGKTFFTKIPDCTFYGCDNLKKINLDEIGVTSIGKSAFYSAERVPIDFSKLTELASIGNEAFAHSGVEVVDLSNTKLENLGSSANAFYNTKSLKYFAFPKSFTAFKSSVFNNCFDLTTVVLSEDFTPANLELLYDVVFDQDHIDIIIPEANTSLVKDEFGVIYDPGMQNLYSAGRGELSDDYVMPDTVLTISKNAFKGVIAKSIIVSENVKTIGDKAFYYASIDYIYIPASVESVGGTAFGSYYSEGSEIIGVKAVEFAKDSKLTKFGSSTFSGDAALESIVLPDSLDFNYSISSVFQNCVNLKSVTFGAATTVVPDRAFLYCTALEEIIMQEGITEIKGVFVYNGGASDTTELNYGLKELKIPSTVTTLTQSFAGFGALEKITFAEGSQLKTIDKNTFSYCRSLKEIVGLPASLSSIGVKAFYNCNSLESLDISHTKITSIPENAFYNTHALESIDFPQKLSSIGNTAFYATGAMDIVFPANLNYIGTNAFENSALKSVTFPAESALSVLGDTETATYIFGNTANLETVTISNDLTVIGNNVFENSGVKKVVVANTEAPAALHTIGVSAFYECARLEEFGAFENVVTIGDYAFFLDASLKAADLTNKLESIGGMAFGFATSLAEAKIPASVTDLGGNPYGGLDISKIKLDPANKFYVATTDAKGALTITDTDKSVIYGVFGATGAYEFDPFVFAATTGAFAGNAITSIEIPKAVNVISECLFMECTSLETVVANNTITSIGQMAFYNNVSLKSINIPTATEEIGDYAFYNCEKLDNIYIPAGTLTIGGYAFANCTSLANVEFEHNNTDVYTTMGTHVFYNCASLTKVVLPTHVTITQEDGKASGGNGTSYIKDAIPSYTFAGTGIVEAVIPGTLKYFYTQGIFANCKNLEYITFEIPPKTNTQYYKLNETWYEGCDKFVGVRANSLKLVASGDSTGDNYANFLLNLDEAGIKTFYINTVTASKLINTAYFYKVSEDFCLYINDPYLDIIDFLAILKNPWTMKIYDKDGNLLISSYETGNVACVKDPNGNIIWGAEPVAPEEEG